MINQTHAHGPTHKSMACVESVEFVGGGTQPNTEPSRGEGLDGSATAEERDNYHRDAYENARNHASGPPAARARALPHHTRF